MEMAPIGLLIFPRKIRNPIGAIEISQKQFANTIGLISYESKSAHPPTT